MQTARLETELQHGSLWRVIVAIGNRKKGTRRTAPVSDSIYTLAQAQCFIDNNRAADFAHLLK